MGGGGDDGAAGAYGGARTVGIRGENKDSEAEATTTEKPAWYHEGFEVIS